MSIEKADASVSVSLLLIEMRYCRKYGYSFTACLAEARRQFNKEVREDALTRPMPAK